MKRLIILLCLISGCSIPQPKYHTYHIKVVSQLGITVYDKKLQLSCRPRIWDNMTPGIISVQSDGTAFSQTIVSTSNLNTVTVERVD